MTLKSTEKNEKQVNLNDISVKLNSMIDKKRIVFLESKNKTEALDHLSRVLSTSEFVKDSDELISHIFKREELMSTGIGLGIAIPHARLDSVIEPVIAVGICKEPLKDYVSLDDKPVKLIIMIAANTNQHIQYIKLLAHLTSIIKEKNIRTALSKANFVDEVYDLLVGVQK